MRNHQAHAILLGTLGLLALGVAGCGTTVPEGTQTVDYQATPRDILHIETRHDSHAIQIDRRTGAVSAPERQRLDSFVQDFGRDRPDSIHAELHGAGSTEELEHVASLLVYRGLERSKIKLFPGERGAAQGARGTDIVTIVATRAIAVIPPCPGWIDHIAAPGDNRVAPNLGCSDASNFAAMVSDPYDLISGQSSNYSDGERAAKAVQDYQLDRVKPLPSTTTLNVTNVGGNTGGANNTTGSSAGGTQ